MNVKSKIGRTILEINAVSFKYYLGIYLILLVLDVWKKNFVFNYFHFLVISISVRYFFTLFYFIKWWLSNVNIILFNDLSEVAVEKRKQ